ncbi:hypothetical protein T08_16620 [Trichinella sp. T8]|nr:hypothetical protein T08_16620 [Trichinella sp. T8]
MSMQNMRMRKFIAYVKKKSQQTTVVILIQVTERVSTEWLRFDRNWQWLANIVQYWRLGYEYDRTEQIYHRK